MAIHAFQQKRQYVLCYQHCDQPIGRLCGSVSSATFSLRSCLLSHRPKCRVTIGLHVLPSMIDETEFYHGAALARLICDPRCPAVRRERDIYVINDAYIAFLKYTTKVRSPWRFTATEGDQHSLARAEARGPVTIGLVCGGDGICAITLEEWRSLTDRQASWLSVRRRFNEMYAVSGAAGELPRKISMQRWTDLLLDNVGGHDA